MPIFFGNLILSSQVNRPDEEKHPGAAKLTVNVRVFLKEQRVQIRIVGIFIFEIGRLKTAEAVTSNITIQLPPQ